MTDPSHHGSHGDHGDLEHQVARLQSEERAEWQKPDQVIDALGLRGDETVCDVGAGPGYFALSLARRLPRGWVYAVDVEPKMVQLLRDRLRSEKVTNVSPILALPDEPLVPPAACDVLLLVDAFHHFTDRVASLRRLRRSLKPGGRLVNIDYHLHELPVGPKPEHKVDRADFLKDAAAAGFALKTEHGFLPYQYFLVLEGERSVPTDVPDAGRPRSRRGD